MKFLNFSFEREFYVWSENYDKQTGKDDMQ